ncbi:hypothetical protein FB451DRAFT_1051455 [Mycena latifolia]|nr:hypothetical protein FB451DRAFT_1051455 [Mycena latifolia]
MYRRTEFWGGPAAEVFDPDRSPDERLKAHVLANLYCFLPFSAGHVGVGQQFAYNKIFLMLIRLLQTFAQPLIDLDACPPHARVPPKWCDGPGRMAVEQFRPAPPSGGLWVKMRESAEVEGV